MTDVWTLDSKLAADTFTVGDLPLSRVLIMQDSQYPWVVLVPRIAGVREIYELEPMQQQQLLQESTFTAMWLMKHFQGDKLNIGALGNVVPQLHLHHIVRFETDAAWPQPVWGQHPAKPYTGEELDAFSNALKEGLRLQAPLS